MSTSHRPKHMQGFTEGEMCGNSGQQQLPTYNRWMHLRCLWTCTVLSSSKKHAHKHKFMNREILKKKSQSQNSIQQYISYLNHQCVQKYNSYIITEKGSKIESALLRFAADKYRCPKWKKSRSSSEWKRLCFYLLPVMQLCRKGWERLEVAPVTLQWLVIDWNGWAKLHNERKVTGSWSW